MQHGVHHVPEKANDDRFQYYISIECDFDCDCRLQFPAVPGPNKTTAARAACYHDTLESPPPHHDLICGLAAKQPARPETGTQPPRDLRVHMEAQQRYRWKENLASEEQDCSSMDPQPKC